MAHKRVFTNKLLILALAASGTLLAASNSPAQTVDGELQAAKTEKPVTQVTKPAASMPVLKEYKQLAIGMTADDVEEKWGKPKVHDKDGYLYEFSDTQTAQVRIDPEKKVSAIAVMFMKKGEAPSLVEIFGEGAKPDTEQNGTIYKLVRYPEAGYWISYYAGAGDDGMTTLTIQKL